VVVIEGEEEQGMAVSEDTWVCSRCTLANGTGLAECAVKHLKFICLKIIRTFEFRTRLLSIIYVHFSRRVRAHGPHTAPRHTLRGARGQGRAGQALSFLSFEHTIMTTN
jgi:hypothetical protein